MTFLILLLLALLGATRADQTGDLIVEKAAIGDLEAVSQLLAGGANVNAVSSFSIGADSKETTKGTALHAASLRRHPAVVKALIAADAFGPRALKPLGGDTYAGRTALMRRRLQGPPAIKQEELAHEPGSPARAACPSVDVELRRCYPSQH